MPDGSQATVMVAPSDDADAIKKKIEEVTGIQPNRQKLLKENEELADGVPAKLLGLHPGSLLNVAFKTIPFCVKSYNGKLVELEMEPTEKVQDLKQLLEAQFTIVPSNQNLSLDGNRLSDNLKRIDGCSIVAGSVLDLEPFAIKVLAETCDGNFEVDLPLDANTAVVKDIIASASGLAAPRQVLKHRGKELPKDEAVKVRDMTLKNGDTVNVSVHKIPITVNNTWDDRMFGILVEPSQSLLDIKKVLALESNIAPANQQLSRAGNELIGDDKSATAHGIAANSIIDLRPKVINVQCQMPDGTTHTVTVKPTDDSEGIKQAIAKATCMAVEKQVVRHHGAVLPEMGKTVKELGIRENSKLVVEVLKVPIRVNLPDGRQIKLMFDITELLSQLKEDLVDESTVPSNKQLLSMYGGEEFIGDDKPLSSFGVGENSVIDLEIKDDPIVFVDIKYGTLFGLQRDESIDSGAITCIQGNPFEFVEAVTTAVEIEKGLMSKAMLESPNLGVKPQIVVEKVRVQTRKRMTW
jgi:hypothetical protein